MGSISIIANSGSEIQIPIGTPIAINTANSINMTAVAIS